MRKIVFTKMSTRGQVVIPKELRKGVDEGTLFAVSREKEKDDLLIMLKKVKTPTKEEFERMLEMNRKIVKKTGLKQSDVMKIIHRIRKENRESKSIS